jgi:hypothetical protein
MEQGNKYQSIIEEVYQSLDKQGLDPQKIPRGHIMELRGSGQCYSLESNSIDAALLKTKRDYQELQGSKYLYKMEYALRGNIKGIESGRVILETKTELKGIIRKKIVALIWVVPGRKRSYLESIGITNPLPGEVWEGSPFVDLKERINGDSPLNLEIIDFMRELGNPVTKLFIISDRWGESIRVDSNLWITPEKITTVYIESNYLDIVSKILGHVKDVRKKFGGLTI